MADDSDLVNQGEIERLLRGSAGAPTADPSAGPATPGQPAGAAASTGEIHAPLTQDAQSPRGSSPALHGRFSDSQTAAAAGEDDKDRVSQSDIDRMLTGTASPGEAAPKQGRREKPSGTAVDENELPQRDMELLFRQAERALASIDETPEDIPRGVAAFQLPEFSGAPASVESATLDLVRDVELDLRIELGRTHMYLEDVLRLRRGSVVPLDKLAGDPVDVYVNGRLIARGEVLVLNDNFCVRVAELIAGANAHA
jgi:flagellar motor switch protein FliN/FliY